MKRLFFLTALMMGAVAISTFAQQPSPLPPPPPASPQPRLKQPMSDEQRALIEQRLLAAVVSIYAEYRDVVELQHKTAQASAHVP